VSFPSRRRADLLFLLLIVSLLSAWSVFWKTQGDRVSLDMARLWNSRVKPPLFSGRGIFKGQYYCNWKSGCTFQPCGLAEAWTLRGDLSGLVVPSAPGAHDSQGYLELKGKVTPRRNDVRPGSCLGLCTRDLIVTKVVTSRKIHFSGCNS
jgi:hypothetical protein